MTNITPAPVHPSAQQYVEVFHTTYGLPIRSEPILDVPEKQLRIDLIEEELEEYREAVAADDIIEMADALGDLVYVVYGAGLAHGINIDALVAHRHFIRVAQRGLPLQADSGALGLSALRQVLEFHRAAGVPIRPLPVVEVPEKQAQIDLLTDAVAVYLKAVADDDVKAVAEALAELIHLAYSTAVIHGINLDPILEEIQRSNLSKLGEDGKPIYRADGKVLKGPGFFTPDIPAVLEAQTPLV